METYAYWYMSKQKNKMLLAELTVMIINYQTNIPVPDLIFKLLFIKFN